MSAASTNGRELPQSADAERGVLGSILREPQRIMPIIERQIGKSYFHIPAHQVIYGALKEMHGDCEPIDAITLTTYLADHKLLDAAGGAAALTELVTSMPTTANIQSYVSILREKQFLRQTIERCGSLVDKAYTAVDETDITAIAAQTQEAADFVSKLALAGKLPSTRPLTDFHNLEIDKSKTILGDRWLCKEGGALFVGPSGIGKSSASVQQDILWALGRPAFGIAPARPLKILCIQAEDDEGDISEMVTGVVRGLAIESDELAQIRESVFYVSEKSHTGLAFQQKIVRPLLSEHRPDLLRINPLLAYLGGDINDAEATAEFLRNGLNPLLSEFQCAALIAHHTPKAINRDTSNWRGSDWMYCGAGSADVTNWARAALVIDPTQSDHVFRFISAKRGRRIGWADEQGEATIFRHFCHASNGSMFWREATPDEIPKGGGKAGAVKKTPADLKALVPMEGAIPKKVLVSLAQTNEIGVNRALGFLEELLESKELFPWRIKRSRTNPEILISRHEQTLV